MSCMLWQGSARLFAPDQSSADLSVGVDDQQNEVAHPSHAPSGADPDPLVSIRHMPACPSSKLFQTLHLRQG